MSADPRRRWARRCAAALVGAVGWLGAPAAAGAQAVPGDEIVLLGDPKLAAEGGVRTVDSLRRALQGYERAFPQLFQPHGSVWLRGAFGVARLAKLLLLDVPLVSLEGTFLHEVYGHGARGREGGRTLDYQFRLPFPYSLLAKDGEFAAFTQPDRGGASRDEDILFTLGGVEANLFTAQLVLRRAMVTGRMHTSDALLYFGKLNYMDSFLASSLERPAASASNDVSTYVTLLQDRANRPRPQDRQQIARNLRAAYLWNLADPFLLFSAYAAVRHVVTGERSQPLPTLRAFGVHFWPSLRFNLSPWGAEHYLGVDVRSPKGVLAEPYVRVGSSGLYRYVGAGFHLEGIETGRLRLGADVDVWSQPQYVQNARNVYQREQVGGLAVAAAVTARVYGPLSLAGKLGVKTDGYVQAQPMAAGVFGFVGVAIGGLPSLTAPLP